jgi:hypothetical protein
VAEYLYDRREFIDALRRIEADLERELDLSQVQRLRTAEAT